MREAYGAEVIAAMRTPESQVTEVSHHRDGVWRDSPAPHANTAGRVVRVVRSEGAYPARARRSVN